VSDVTRRDLFTFWRKGKPAEPPADPLRPPGAVFDDLLVDSCSRCHQCADACPAGAIVALDESFGRAAGTPGIVPRQAACVMCDGLLCTQACPTHVLTRVARFDVQMGTAVVDPARCTTYAGRACGDCVSACPVSGALAAVDGHPVVDPGRCTGCGTCEKLCPVPGPAAISVIPARPIAR
jgi:ferredoxin-type protein NapF